jgi:hypothetical protein
MELDGSLYDFATQVGAGVTSGLILYFVLSQIKKRDHLLKIYF